MPTLPQQFGRLRTFAIAFPAAPGEIGIVYDQRVRQRILSARFTLSTDANVADRFLTWFISSSGCNSPIAISGIAQTAGTVRTYNFAFGYPTTPFLIGSELHCAMPFHMIVEGIAFFTTNTTGIQAADQFSGLSLSVEEWIEP